MQEQDKQFAGFATVLGKYKISIPKKARDALGIQDGDRVDCLVDEGRVSLVRAGAAERFVGSTRVSPSGQVTLPRQVRKIVQIRQGDRFAFLAGDGRICLVPEEEFAATVFAQRLLQGWESGECSEEDSQALVRTFHRFWK